MTELQPRPEGIEFHTDGISGLKETRRLSRVS